MKKTLRFFVLFYSTAIFFMAYLSVKADPVVLTNIPAYTWYSGTNGCGPKSVAMVFGYWDLCGYNNLFNAQGNALFIDSNVTNEIISIANFSNTDANGATTSINLVNGLKNYASSKGYTFSATGANFTTDLTPTTWASLTNEITAGRPMIFLVDMNASGQANHFVPVFGHNNTSTGQFYACYTTYTNVVSWYKLQPKGNIYGIVSSIKIIPPALPNPPPKKIMGTVIEFF